MMPSSGDHVPKRRGSMYDHHDQEQQYYFFRDDDERFSFPADDDDLLSHDHDNSSINIISTTAAAPPMPLIFMNDGGLIINQQLPNYTTTAANNNNFFSDYGALQQPAAAYNYNLLQLGSGNLGNQLMVNKDGRMTMSSIMDANTTTSAPAPAAAASGVTLTNSTTPDVTGNSSVSSPSTDQEEDAAAGDQEDSSSSRMHNNNTTSIINCKGDYNINHHPINNMDDQEKEEQQQMATRGRDIDDDTTTAVGDKSKKLMKKGEKRQREPKFAFMTKSEVDHLEDGYRWRKYGQKAVKNSAYPRSYYRCTTQKCSVKKRVERSYQDPSIVITTYEGQHTHQSPATVRGSTHILAPLPPSPSTLTMPLSSFHRDNNRVLKLHQLMNTSRHELGTAAGAIFNPSSININNTNYLQSLITSDPSLQGQQLPAAADHYGHIALPSSFNINSNQLP